MILNLNNEHFQYVVQMKPKARLYVYYIIYNIKKLLTQKVINNDEVPDRVKCLSGTALNHQRKTSLEAKVFVLLGK